MNHINKKILLLLLILLPGYWNLHAQDIDNSLESRTGFTLNTKIAKKLKLNLSPELRFDENLSLNKYLIETELDYKLNKSFSLDAGLRLYGNKRDTKSTEFYRRVAFGLTYSKWISRIESSLKTSYTNSSDDDENGNFLRYKAKFKYDIRKSKFTPYLSAEAFHQIDANELYKMRYGAGINYKLFKKNSISLSYKFDYYLHQNKNKHIIGISYKLKL